MTHACIHCSAPIYSNTRKNFCCLGCKTAYSLIKKLNLHQFYEYCRNIYNASPPTVQAISNELDYLEHVINKNDHYQTYLLVENIKCGSCIWLIEHTLKAQPNVINARVNLSTNRMLIEWQGAKEEITNLVATINKLGYKLIPFDPSLLENDYKKQENELLKRLGIAVIAAANVMMLSIGIWAGNAGDSLGIYTRSLLHYLTTIITIPAALYSGVPFFRNAITAVKARRSNMDIPISIAIILTLVISLLETWQSHAYTYFDAALSLISALLAGRYLELRARNKARDRARQLVLAQARAATIWRDNQYVLTNIKNIRPNDEVLVTSGAIIPADGIIIEGNGHVDNSLITGESIPVPVKKGVLVHAGTLNLGDPLKLIVKSCGEDTVLGEIIRLMENAEQGRAKYVDIADRVSRWYMPLVLSASFITFGFWFGWQQIAWQQALLYAVSLLIITCPCALAIAVPVVQVTASARLFAKGIYIRTSNALEKLAEANVAILDKTGTLTTGTPTIINRNEIDDKTFNLIARLAAASKHPLCKAINELMKNSRPLKNIQEQQGIGLTASLTGRKLYLGKLASAYRSDDIYSETWFVDGNKPPIRLIFKDALREDAAETLAKLQKTFQRIIMLSGDRPSVVQGIAKSLAITEAHSNMLPADKCNFIINLQQQGLNVLMVGDGLNDAAALKQANVSISPITALDLPQSCADVVFTGKKLIAIPEAIKVAKQSDRIVKENFTISFAYNIISIPLAFWGMVTPLIATIAMSTSSLLVIFNSLRLLRSK
jgi:Cu2+-exporting ATPase